MTSTILYLLLGSLVFLSVADAAHVPDYDNITKTATGLIETMINDNEDLRSEIKDLRSEVRDLRSNFSTLNDEVKDLYADVKHENWHLGMNLNPSDGHVMGYGTGWHTGEQIGSKSTAFSKDYLSKSVWRQPANYIAIVRHQGGVLDAVKVWKFKTPGLSLLERFKDMDPGRIIATSGGPVQVFLAQHARNLHDDPIFSIDGDLALNWAYSNNGNRIVLTGGHLSDAGVNDNDTDGLGNDFAIDTKTGTGSGTHAHEISYIQDVIAAGGKVKMQGTDHGTWGNFISGPVYGNYAIYVSIAATRFPVLNRSLATEMDKSIIAK